MRFQRGTSLPVAGIAIAGVVAGHALAYVIAVRQPVHRSDILHATGHTYWTAAIALAIVVGFGALAAVGLRVLRGQDGPGDPHPFAFVAPRLAAVQVVAYISIELTERLLSGVPVAELLDHHEVLPIGAAIQLLVALAGALVLHLLARTLALVVEALRTPRSRRLAASGIPLPSTPPTLRGRALRGAWGLRGPPILPSPAAGS